MGDVDEEAAVVNRVIETGVDGVEVRRGVVDEVRTGHRLEALAALALRVQPVHLEDELVGERVQIADGRLDGVGPLLEEPADSPRGHLKLRAVGGHSDGDVERLPDAHDAQLQPPVDACEHDRHRVDEHVDRAAHLRDDRDLGELGQVGDQRVTLITKVAGLAEPLLGLGDLRVEQGDAVEQVVGLDDRGRQRPVDLVEHVLVALSEIGHAMRE